MEAGKPRVNGHYERTKYKCKTARSRVSPSVAHPSPLLRNLFHRSTGRASKRRAQGKHPKRENPLNDGEFNKGDEEASQTKVARLFYGKHECQESNRGGVNLRLSLRRCEKNPGHTHFIPVDNFTLNHLPEGHQDADLHELIRTTAELTLQLEITIISGRRPEVWPKGSVPYPLHVSREKKSLRTGTGRVTGVKKRKGCCKCRKCRRSDDPSKVWVEVKVLTATHVVFDDLEARHTRCRLFYDSEASPPVYLDGWKVETASIEDDSCEMTCVTCDLPVLDKLDAILKRRDVPRNKVIDTLSRSGHVGKMSFIISHPHGCSKQISIGRWKDRRLVRKGRGRLQYTQLLYTTCTCPGSSGAHVFSLGYDNWLRGHVHSGVYHDGTNFSGTGGEVTYAQHRKRNYSASD